jgi:hypothetical protein
MHRIIRRRCRRALGVRKSVAGLDNDADDDDDVERFIIGIRPPIEPIDRLPLVLL